MGDKLFVTAAELVTSAREALGRPVTIEEIVSAALRRARGAYERGEDEERDNIILDAAEEICFERSNDRWGEGTGDEKGADLSTTRDWDIDEAHPEHTTVCVRPA